MQIKMRFLTQSKKMGVILTEKKKTKRCSDPPKILSHCSGYGHCFGKIFRGHRKSRISARPFRLWFPRLTGTPSPRNRTG